MSDSPDVENAKRLLNAEGYVWVKAETYRRVLRDRDIADARRKWAESELESHKAWAHNAWDEERFLRNRLTFVYGVAREKGATTEELRGDDEQANTILRYPSGQPAADRGSTT